jgi:hypothetical protein
MNNRLLYGTIVLALTCGIGSGVAQVQIQLDAAQELRSSLRFAM